MLITKRMCCVRWLRFSDSQCGGSKRKTFQTGSRIWPRHVTRLRSDQRTSLNQLPPPLTSINTSPQNGCASITHCLLDVHRLAICTTEELSLQPAWTSPISSSELRQRSRQATQKNEEKGWAPCAGHTLNTLTSSSIAPCTFLCEFGCYFLIVTRLEHPTPCA